MKTSLSIYFMSLIFLSGCGGGFITPYVAETLASGNSFCTLEARSALTIFINNSTTDPEYFDGVVIEIQDGGFHRKFTVHRDPDFPSEDPRVQWIVTSVYDTLGLNHPISFHENYNSIGFSTLYERAGNYHVTISHPELGEVLSESVEVTKDECHVTTQEVEATL